MGMKPKFMFGKVMHKRFFPAENAFTYGIYYIAFSLSNLSALKNAMAFNRMAGMSFFEKDHGDCDGANIELWARDLLSQYNLDQANGDITMICMPRILNYVFNPVSFLLCHDKKGNLRAVLAEVHNTFGEKHTYICVHEDQRIIGKSDILEAHKVFHVSPFLEREGHYTFRFDSRQDKFGAWINFHDAKGHKKLVTSLVGDFEDINRKTRSKAFWRYPLVTFKAIILIHWQALKIIAKGIQYISKPDQLEEKSNHTQKITKV